MINLLPYNSVTCFVINSHQVIGWHLKYWKGYKLCMFNQKENTCAHQVFTFLEWGVTITFAPNKWSSIHMNTSNYPLHYARRYGPLPKPTSSSGKGLLFFLFRCYTLDVHYLDLWFWLVEQQLASRWQISPIQRIN